MHVTHRSKRSFRHLVPAVLIALFLTSCDIDNLVNSQKEEDEPDVVTQSDAVAAKEAVAGIVELLFDGAGAPPSGDTLPDFAAGSYLTGISVSVTSASDLTVTLTMGFTSFSPPAEAGEVPPDAQYDGSFTFTITSNTDGSVLTITMDGSLSAEGSDALFGTMEVTSVIGVVPVTSDGLGEPSSLQGTLTVDGTAYDIAYIIDDSDGAAPPTPAEAPYFLMSYYVDAGGTNIPQIVYFSQPGTYGTIPLSGTGTLKDGATDSEGRSVAVGENGMIFSTDDGANWTRRADGITTSHLHAVAWANNTWIAVGTDVILRSTNGIDWSVVGAGSSSGTDLRAIAWATGSTWRAAGAPPQSILVSTDNGASWSVETADSDLRPQNTIQELFWNESTSQWLAMTGDPGGAIYRRVVDDTNSNGNNNEWIPTVDNIGEVRAAARYGDVIAATVNSGSTSLRVTSDAGTTWSTKTLSESLNGYPVDMVPIGNGFLAVTNMGGLLRGSADGQTWEVLTEESYGSWGVLYRPSTN